MQLNKHNQILCSKNTKFGLKFGKTESKNSQLKNRFFSWSLLFVGVFVFLMLFGFSPLEIIINTLKANYTKTETIKLYASSAIQDKEAESFEEGWWNMDFATFAPQIPEDGNLVDFNDGNSAFYTGGNFSLSFSGFRFLEEDLGVFSSEEEVDEELIREEEETIEETATIDASVELITDVENTGNQEFESSAITEDEVVSTNDIKTITDEEIEVLEKNESSDEIEVITDGDIVNDFINEEDIFIEENTDEGLEPLNIESDENLQEFDSQDNIEIEIIEEDEASLEELEETPAEAEEILDLGFLDTFDNIWGTTEAKAIEMVSEGAISLSDLGVFKSASIKLSMAMQVLGVETEPESNTVTSVDDINQEEQIVIEEEEEIISQNKDTELVFDEDSINTDDLELKLKEDDLEVLEAGMADAKTEGISVEITEGAEEEAEVIVEEEDEIIEASVETVEEVEEVIEIEENFSEESVETEEISLFQFIKKAQAQSSILGEAKLIIWYGISSTTGMADDVVWHKLDTLSDDLVVNALSDGYFSFDASFLSNWEDIENLQLRVEAIDAQNEYIAYIDGVWVEAEYEPSDTVKKINERKEWEKALSLVSNKLDFAMNEQGVLKFHYLKNRQALLDSVGEMFGLASYWEDIDINVSLQDMEGNFLDLPLSMIFEEDGNFEIRLPYMPRGYKPGKYKLVFTISDLSSGDEQTIDIGQNFSWGVLAINANKSIYGPDDDTAYLQMAVLDDYGHTLCEAELSLEITSPTGITSVLSTDNGLLARNPECVPEKVMDDPDYYAFYIMDEFGEYNLSLTAVTDNGTYTINDILRKDKYVAYDVERVGPTRIYPLADYDMAITIKANENFSGNIYDYVPIDFEIATQTVYLKEASSSEYLIYNDTLASTSPKSKFREMDFEYEKEISWTNIDLEIADELIIVYNFDAPDISPEFYLLGPLEIAEWHEAREWQIASDVIIVSTSTNGVHVGWASSTWAWDNGVDTYAYREIPKKTGGGEPANYIQSNINSSVNLGGDINTVEVGIEGYVDGTTITTYVTPYFGGISAGDQYQITATEMENTDTSIPFYIDITNSTNAPTTWTWADVANLDVRLFGGNSSNSTPNNLYIDQIYIRVDYTPNNPPDSEFISVLQRKDDSGVVDITVKVYDEDNDNSRARLDYVPGNTCDFSTPLDPTLDETDANATSSPGDADIDNNQIYQIGTSTGYITMSGGTSTVNFDWLSALDTSDTEGDYCLQLTATDGDNVDASPATTTLTIDNKAPSAPGTFVGASSTKESVTLYYGATSSDMHFLEYRIYYATSSDIDELDYMHASKSDINLNNVLFNSEATTTILGLLENVTYYFSMFAYDEYGHVSSSTVFSYKTNKAPTAIFTSASPATQKTDGSGVVDISIDVDDLDTANAFAIAKLEYVQGADCSFGAGGLDPLLDETSANIGTSYGVVSIENDNDYQIGNANGYILTPATNTVSFDWDTVNDLPNADDTYCLRLTANDLIDDQNNPATTTLVLDNVDPTAPGNLIVESKSTSTITLAFGNASSDTNFSHYDIHYKEGISGVTEANIEFSSSTIPGDPSLGLIDYNGAGSTTLEGLIPSTDYVINIWAYDLFGHASSAQEITVKTNGSVNNVSLTLTNPVTSNWLVLDAVTEYNFQAVVSEANGYAVLDEVVLRLADDNDYNTPFSDLEFTWSQSEDTFTETGTDINSAVSVGPSSSSVCADNSCTLNFNLIFANTFASTSVDYDAELYTTNDSAVEDFDTYLDFYQTKLVYVEQIHYRWRNDDGGE
ncbi:hypothetical protein C0583_05520 [Candidatus Parcubacteria bacterium]|nr:MAG: hypothetical protein C0583_05520 [Candidatus Parcubacteria bacterium]